MTKTDDRFLARVYRTSGMLWVVGSLALAGLQNWSALMGWTAGSALSFGLVRSLEVVVRRSFVPGTARPRQDLTRFSLVKLPIVIAILAAIVWLGGRDFALIGAFCAGAALVQAAIVLNTLRSMTVDRQS